MNLVAQKIGTQDLYLIQVAFDVNLVLPEVMKSRFSLKTSIVLLCFGKFMNVIKFSSQSLKMARF